MNAEMLCTNEYVLYFDITKKAPAGRSFVPKTIS